MEKTWKGTTAGILTLIGGCVGIGIGRTTGKVLGSWAERIGGLILIGIGIRIIIQQ